MDDARPAPASPAGAAPASAAASAPASGAGSPVADRYGRRGGTGRRPVLLVGAVVAMLAAVGFIGWVAWEQGRRVTWQEITFDAGDPYRTGLTFQVTRPPGAAVTCTVKALNRRQQVVGRRDVPVPPSRERTDQVSTDIRAAEPAVAAAVDRCAITG